MPDAHPSLTAVFATPLEEREASRAFRFFLIDVGADRAREVLGEMDRLEGNGAGTLGREQIRTDNDPVDLVVGEDVDRIALPLRAAIQRSLRRRHAIEIASDALPDDDLRQPSRAARHVTPRAAFWSTYPESGPSERTVPLPRWMLHRFLLRDGPDRDLRASFMELVEERPDVAGQLLEVGLHPDVGEGDGSIELVERLGEDDLMTLLTHSNRRLRKRAILAAGDYYPEEAPDRDPPRTR